MATLDPTATALQLQSVLAAAGYFAIVDQHFVDAGKLQKATRIIGKPAIAAIEHETGKLDTPGFIRIHQMAVAAIDEPRGAGNACDARVIRECQV